MISNNALNDTITSLHFHVVRERGEKPCRPWFTTSVPPPDDGSSAAASGKSPDSSDRPSVNPVTRDFLVPDTYRLHCSFLLHRCNSRPIRKSKQSQEESSRHCLLLARDDPNRSATHPLPVTSDQGLFFWSILLWYYFLNRSINPSDVKSEWGLQ